MEEGPISREVFIGDMEFGIIPEVIDAGLNEAREEIRLAEIELEKEGVDERMRELFDFVCELEGEGLGEDDILARMEQEKPDVFRAIGIFYEILRIQTWGYRLGTRVASYQMRRRG